MWACIVLVSQHHAFPHPEIVLSSQCRASFGCSSCLHAPVRHGQSGTVERTRLLSWNRRTHLPRPPRTSHRPNPLTLNVRAPAVLIHSQKGDAAHVERPAGWPCALGSGYKHHNFARFLASWPHPAQSLWLSPRKHIPRSVHNSRTWTNVGCELHVFSNITCPNLSCRKPEGPVATLIGRSHRQSSLQQRKQVRAEIPFNLW